MHLSLQEVPIFSWTGGYIGLQGGGLWSDSSIDAFDDADTGVFSDNFNGGLFGGYAGYNWQSGAWVFGVEGDINGVWNDETFNIGGFDVDVGSDYLASLRGRVGYAFDRTLIFATGGVAFTQFSAEVDLDDDILMRTTVLPAGPSERAPNTPSPTTGLAASNTAIMTSATVTSMTSATSNSIPTR